jgi:hypothetical protein
MSANINTNLANWSTTAGSNQPDATDVAAIVEDLQMIQAVVRKYTRTIGANIASAGTVNLAVATGDYVVVTGTTGVTGFGTVAAGMRYFVEFDGALTITHAATLLCPGAKDIKTAAGDVVWLESKGSGNWKVLAHFANVAQAWTNVTGSRALDTEYTNTTSKPISVTIAVNTTGVSAQIFLKVDGIPVATGFNSAQSQLGPVLVPPGSTYEAETINSPDGTINFWSEYR